VWPHFHSTKTCNTKPFAKDEKDNILKQNGQNNQICSSLDLECVTKVSILKAWSPVGTIDRNFLRGGA
jgi:hypothetical protein